MDRKALYAQLDETPVIGAVKDDAGLAACLAADVQVLFVLYGTVCSIADIVRRAKEAGRCVFVHIDLVTGLSAKEVAVDFIRQNTGADGIISTRPALIRRAAEVGLLTVQRYFLLDSIALESLEKQTAQPADLVEVLPGTMPKILRRICARVQTPLIAGGLICDKDDVMAALSAGARAVSTTNAAVWRL